MGHWRCTATHSCARRCEWLYDTRLGRLQSRSGRFDEDTSEALASNHDDCPIRLSTNSSRTAKAEFA